MFLKGKHHHQQSSMYISVFPCVEITCPNLEKVVHLLTDSSAIDYGVTITLTCEVGYMFADGITLHTMTCMDDGEWSSDLPICSRMWCNKWSRMYARENDWVE